jgi:polysaccharide biosynthesis protein PslE
MSDPVQDPRWNRGATDQAPDELPDVMKRMAASFSRRRRLFVTVFLVSAAIIQAVAFAWPGTFAAHAAILIEKTRYASRLDADPSEPMTTLAQGVTEDEVNSETAVLTSAEVLTATMQNTGLDQAPEPWYLRALFAPLRAYDQAYAWWHEVPTPSRADRTLRALGNAISATRMKDSNVMIVTYEAGDPRTAELVLHELLKRYLDQHLVVHRPMDVHGFFTEQAGLLSGELRGYEEELRRLKQQLGVSEAASERDVALKLDAVLREEEAALQRRRAEIDANMAAYEAKAEIVPNRITTTSQQESSTLAELKSSLAQLELEQIRLEARFQPGFPLLAEHERKVAAARRALERERAQLTQASTSAASPVVITIEQELARLTAEREGVLARLGAVRGQLAASRAQLMKLDEAVTEAARIDRLIRTTEQRYMMYLDRQDKARVDTALDQGRFTNVSIVQNATASPRPVRPSKLVSLFVAIFGGLLVAFVTCISLELSSIQPGRLLTSAAPRPAEV